MVFRKDKDLLEEYLPMQRIAALQGPADILQDDMSADLTQCQWPSLSSVSGYVTHNWASLIMGVIRVTLRGP